MPVILNKSYRRAVIQATANATTTVQLTDIASSNETMEGMTITQVFWSGNCSVSRGANTVLSYASGTSGHMNFMGAGMSLTMFPQANLVLKVGDINSCLIVEVGKISHGVPSEY